MTNLNNVRIDDSEVLFFANELTHYDPREFETIKSGLSFLDIFHCNTSIDRGQESYTYNIYSGLGEAKEITKNSKDIPFVTATGEQFTTSFVNIGSAIEYTTQDLLASNIAKKDILSRYRSQAMRANFELMNKRCFFGNKELGITGLFSDPNITNKKEVSKQRNKTSWNDKTSEEILKDIVDTYNDCMESTNNLIRPDTLLLSSLAYNQISTKIFNNFHGTTILKQIETMLRVTVKSIPELNKAINGTDCFVFFKNSNHYVEQLIPSFFHIEEPIRHMNGFEVGCFSRYGGLVIRQPKMFAIRYGI